MHFQSKLHKNSILTGSLDSYCLVCDNYLRSEDEAFIHTEKPIHKKNMASATRVEKFVDDQIIKVKKGYYCPFCNILLSTTTKVNIHIGDVNHQERKGAQMLSLVGDNIIAFDEVAIALETWHGLMEYTCLICNTEFDEDEMHRTGLSHMLRLVQSKCEFGDKYVYRKVDEDSFFCLICGNVFSINEKLSHHQNIGHKNLYDLAKEMKNNIPLSTKKTDPPKPNIINTSNPAVKSSDEVKNADKDTHNTNPEVKLTQIPAKHKTPDNCKIRVPLSTDEETLTLVKNTALANNVTDKNQKKTECVNGAKSLSNKNKETTDYKTSDNERHSNILDKVDEFQKKGIDIDFTWERARCKACNKDMPFDVASIEHHIEAQHMTKKITENIEPKTNAKNHLQKLDNDVKSDIKTLGVEKTDVKKVADGVDPKLDTKKQRKRSVTSNEIKTDPKKTDNGMELKTDTMKVDNSVEPKVEMKKRKKSEYSETITNSKKTDKGIEPKQPKKSDTKINLDKTKELEVFAKENQIVLLPKDAYCTLCKTDINLTKTTIYAHANLSSHKDKNFSQNGILGTAQISEYMETFIRVESNLGSEIILNNKYALRQHSYHCIVTVDEGYKCVLCDADIRIASVQLSQHLNGPEHKNKMGTCKIMRSMPEEFIREITSNKFHCGYCNEMFEGWTQLQDHLSRSTHMYARRHAQWNLERCHSVIRNARFMQVSSMHAINYT